MQNSKSFVVYFLCKVELTHIACARL